jgi:hypothetical protein
MENLKQLAKSIEEKLTSKEGFKSIHGNGFFGGRAKKSFAVWSEAEKKAVLPLYLVQQFVHQEEDSTRYYAIYAFSTKGEIEANTFARLKQAASRIDLGIIRYECMGYTRLELWRSKGQSSFLQGNNTIATTLSDVAHGLFVYAEFLGSGSKAVLDKPLVIYAHYNDGDYIYPIKKTTLSKINL